MKVCKNCNTSLEDDAVFCAECGTKVDEETVTLKDFAKEAGKGLGEIADITSKVAKNVGKVAVEAGKVAGQSINKTAETAKMNYQAANTNKTNFVELAEGEVFVREYEVTKFSLLFFIRYSGKLMITNKRIVFYSFANDKIMLSTPINKVGAINFITGFIFNSKFIILSLILFIYSRSLDGGFMAFLMLILSLICLFSGIKKSFYLSIASESSSQGIVVGKPNTLGASMYTLDGVAGAEAEKAMSEIGAIVLDFQQMGDLAIEKWKL